MSGIQWGNPKSSGGAVAGKSKSEVFAKNDQTILTKGAIAVHDIAILLKEDGEESALARDYLMQLLKGERLQETTVQFRILSAKEKSAVRPLWKAFQLVLGEEEFAAGKACLADDATSTEGGQPTPLRLVVLAKLQQGLALAAKDLSGHEIDKPNLTKLSRQEAEILEAIKAYIQESKS